MPIMQLRARPVDPAQLRATPVREWALSECASNGAQFSSSVFPNDDTHATLQILSSVLFSPGRWAAGAGSSVAGSVRHGSPPAQGGGENVRSGSGGGGAQGAPPPPQAKPFEFLNLQRQKEKETGGGGGVEATDATDEIMTDLTLGRSARGGGGSSSGGSCAATASKQEPPAAQPKKAPNPPGTLD